MSTRRGVTETVGEHKHDRCHALCAGAQTPLRSRRHPARRRSGTRCLPDACWPNRAMRSPNGNKRRYDTQRFDTQMNSCRRAQPAFGCDERPQFSPFQHARFHRCARARTASRAAATSVNGRPPRCANRRLLPGRTNRSGTDELGMNAPAKLCSLPMCNLVAFGRFFEPGSDKKG